MSDDRERSADYSRGDDAERGSVTLFVAVVAVALLIAIGLVVDGGQHISASQLADNAAGEAARAAGQHITGAAVVGSPPEADTARAVQAARDYLDAADVAGTVTVSGSQITVNTMVERQPILLSIAGVTKITSTGSASVRLARG